MCMHTSLCSSNFTIRADRPLSTTDLPVQRLLMPSEKTFYWPLYRKSNVYLYLLYPDHGRHKAGISVIQSKKDIMQPSPLLKKRKMQDVSFKSVEEFLAFIPVNELSLVTKLREIIFQAIPDCHEKLAYNVPYYKRHANICFIWPASILWGGKSQYEGVRFGFTKGFLLKDENGYLDKGNRKEVSYKDFTHVDEIDETVLISLILRAADVDVDRYLSKKMTRYHF